MANSMKILQIEAPGQPVWRQAPVPVPKAGEVLLKVEGVTTCPHWDLHILDGEPMFPGFHQPYPYHPGQPGHELVGEVVQRGEGVRGLAAGTRVAAWRDSGLARQGGYAQFVALPAENVLAIPPDLALEAIAALELAMCVQVSIDQLEAIGALAGRRVAIAGLGPGGLIAVQLARAHGAREIIGIDPLPARCALARRLGTDQSVAPDDPALPADRKSPAAFDAALDTTGLKVSIEALMARTRQTVAIFGVLRETLAFGPAHWYGGFALLGYGEHNRAAGERALAHVLAGRLDLRPLVTARLPLSRYAEGIARLRRKAAIKILFDPWA